MLNSGEKIRAVRSKKINILTLCCPEKKFGTKRKTITPTIKLNGRSLSQSI